jgi:DNA-binding transcriptional MerR regulator
MGQAWAEVVGVFRQPPAGSAPQSRSALGGTPVFEPAPLRRSGPRLIPGTPSSEPTGPRRRPGSPLIPGKPSRQESGATRVTYSAVTAQSAAGVSSSQLYDWMDSDLIRPSGRTVASHHVISQVVIEFTLQDIFELKVISRLLATGVPLDEVRHAIGLVRELGDKDLDRVTLMSDGLSVYICTQRWCVLRHVRHPAPHALTCWLPVLLR